MQVQASGKLHQPNFSDHVFAFFLWFLRTYRQKGCNPGDAPWIFVSGWGESWRHTSVKEFAHSPFCSANKQHISTTNSHGKCCFIIILNTAIQSHCWETDVGSGNNLFPTLSSALLSGLWRWIPQLSVTQET